MSSAGQVVSAPVTDVMERPSTTEHTAARRTYRRLIVSVAVLVTPLVVAEMVTVPFAAEGDVDTANVALDCPAATDTVAGTDAWPRR